MNDIRPSRQSPRHQLPSNENDQGSLAPLPATKPKMPTARATEVNENSPTSGTGFSLESTHIEKRKRKWPFIVGILCGLLLLVGIGAYSWYQSQLGAVDESSTVQKTIAIESGASPQAIGRLLKGEGLIRDIAIFELYLRLTGTASSLQAGRHVLSPSMDVPTVVTTLAEAEPEQISITFLPGATVSDNKKVLVAAGYGSSEVDKAFAKQYDHPVFKDKPSSADLEGYVYGETYNFSADASVESILVRTFDELNKVVTSNSLIESYKSQDLTLYEGITLASMIQRESGGDDKAQIAQVFLLRLRTGMQLGSDVTYQYIADKLGVARDVNLDNPYNTRRYEGLPPGPIAAPGLDSLRAVAMPAEGDYLFFLSGDDDVTYFARTQAEHESNIQNHCSKKCQII